MMDHFKFFTFFSAACINISLTHFINLFIIISIHKSPMTRHQKCNRAPRRRMGQWEGQAGNSQLPHDVRRTNRVTWGTEKASWSFASSFHSPLLPKHKRAASWAWSKQRHALPALASL